MRAITAHPLMIPAKPTEIGNQLAGDWPSWTEFFHNLGSVGRKFMTAISRPMEDYNELLFLWRAMSASFSGESISRDIVDGYSETTSFPPQLFKKLFRYQTDNENIISVYVTENGIRKRAAYFPRTSFYIDYLQCLQFTTKTATCFLHTVDYGDQHRAYLVFEKRFDQVEITFAADKNHGEDYTVVISKDKLVLDHLWDALDEWGLKMGLDRNIGEHDMFYARRLNDILVHIGNASDYGIRNAVAREFGLITNMGNFRIPLTYVGETEDAFGDPVREDEPATPCPRVLQFAKWQGAQEGAFLPTTTRDPNIRHVVIRVAGSGYFVVTPTPDHIYGFTSVGNVRDKSVGAAYVAHFASGKTEEGNYIWDPNAATVEVSCDNAEQQDAFFVLEYRERVSRNMPEDKPVDMVYIRETTTEIYTPYAQDYITMVLLSRNFAVNDDDYKACHFNFYDGPADYTPEQKAHYLGLSTEGLKRTIQWQNRHEAFTSVTQQGLNTLTHERVAEIINEKTKVMWGKWLWGQTFFWEEDLYEDPTAPAQLDNPRMEAGLEYVPNIWDSDFRRGR